MLKEKSMFKTRHPITTHEIFLFRVSETRQQSCRLIKNFPRDKCLQVALRPIYLSRGLHRASCASAYKEMIGYILH